MPLIIHLVMKVVLSAVKSRYWELRSHSHTTKVLYLGKSGNVSHERQLLSYL